MGKNITDDEVIRHKKKAIKELNNTFEAFINSPNCKHKKKADLIAYWIESYSKYLLMEEKFDYKSIPKYKRGDIISLNFGFNVGSEHGGLHYAIVLDNDNKQSSPVVTVIPLSSGDEKSTYARDVFLGNELHTKLSTKYRKLETVVNTEFCETTKMISVLEKSVNNAEQRKDIDELLGNLYQKIAELEKKKSTLQKYANDISKLKEGSIALMEQITTISKIRIYKPKKSDDLLYGVKLSDSAMNKINEKLKELYVYSK